MQVEKEGSTFKYIMYLVIVLLAVFAVYWAYVTLV